MVARGSAVHQTSLTCCSGHDVDACPVFCATSTGIEGQNEMVYIPGVHVHLPPCCWHQDVAPLHVTQCLPSIMCAKTWQALLCMCIACVHQIQGKESHVQQSLHASVMLHALHILSGHQHCTARHSLHHAQHHQD